jgi:hypothetical protein
MRSVAVTLLVLISLVRASVFPLNQWPNPAVSWYSPDNNWPGMIDQVAANPGLVTSVMVYCGAEVADDGTIVQIVDSTCIASGGEDIFSELIALGVRPELVLNSGNCSIDAYRTLWTQNINTSIAALVSMAVNTNASGWNIDLEPQADNCQGTGTGEASDAVLFAGWLASLRNALHGVNVRLTVDVASWSPVLSQFTTLAPSVDRLMDMDTYNAASLDSWLASYGPMGNSDVPRSVAGIGLGCWVDSSTNGTWSVTPASATERIAQCLSDGVPELAMFRLVPVTGLSFGDDVIV